MNIKIIAILISLIWMGNSARKDTIQLWTIGDSTMANKKAEVFPETGWGQVLHQFFDDGVKIHNHARNGRSTKSFIDEGRWKVVLDSLKPGDYVFIQFGHNDEKIKDSTRYTVPFGSYSDNLKRFVTESREKGATPILLTPIVRRKFDAKGKLLDTHKDYPVAVRKGAKQLDVPLIDMEKLTRKMIQSMGPEKAKELYVCTPPTKRYPEGRHDDTHLKVKGAQAVASLAAQALKKLPLGLSKHVVAQRPVVGLDNWFNREHNKAGKLYHYTWNDTLNSGYSQLGDIFKAKGAELRTIGQAPTAAELGYLDVYIIVDPDTTSENPQPNYISKEDIQSITNWVKNGGVLLLLANDGPNCEFTHMDQLAGAFGIHFIPETLNPVINHKWEMGAETNLPDHPLFKGVKKIYMKEVAGIRVSQSAHPVLTDGKDILMAKTTFGKGKVLAVGDPWLYNEYIGNSRLPKSFENRKAAHNLVNYLLDEVNQ
ncbi:GDSL-type esterase/lipase family protein [Prolixibacter sp. NT017]|uniref:GDSL-type esterase/lipase family protein n=1 Tax=Prolixibacter sp. NT017 TaxID=2652390 RepID=UPI001282B8DD|nr:DUF4350 domain-containing protein [Prolixibacter sp. NT017]GET26969.1 hypothetical protein NT017_32980 [Prolixibacter sp. NT017]